MSTFLVNKLHVRNHFVAPTVEVEAGLAASRQQQGEQCESQHTHEKKHAPCQGRLPVIAAS